MKKYALIRPPDDTFVNALRMNKTNKIDIGLARYQHLNYCRTLENIGYNLLYVGSNNDYPDSTFVEDPVVIIEDSLVIARMCCQERQGEELLVNRDLRSHFKKLFYIESPGYLEGGDVVVGNDGCVYIGISCRTDIYGARQLAKIVFDNYGYKSVFLSVPRRHLHLKELVTFHRTDKDFFGDVIVVQRNMAYSFFSYKKYRMIITPNEERFGANVIINADKAIVSKSCPMTCIILEKNGFDVIKLDMSEFEKVDGGLTCLSKIFTLEE